MKKAIKLKPEKGYRFLKSLRVGDKFKTQTDLKGTVLRKSIGSVLCMFTEVQNQEPEDKGYYLGKRRIAPETNVKKIRS
tara:strand:+ start:561 stop:797 length:237 start_codon:yes stop_codon:yes gene_type:complete